MKNGNASERVATLVHEAIDVLQRADNAPDSPVNTFLPAKLRRELRRGAERLRQRRAQPRYRNLHTSEELADIYERTVQRDEILEQGLRDFTRITRDLGRILEENDPEVGKAIETLIMEAKRSAEEHGPGSEAAQRYRQLQLLAWFGQQYHSHKRRQRSPVFGRVPLASDPSVEVRNQVTAAELLASPPSSGETVIAIPPDGKDHGRGRIFIRIGVGEASWIGSFERGHMSVSTIFMMPDAKHLFVSAEGAGYIIDAKSRTLVEEIGTEIAGVMRDDPMTVLFVNHNDMSLEAYGRTGRLWKTDTIGSGGLRRMAITDDKLVGEARHPSRPGWAGFSVKLATGEVRFARDGVRSTVYSALP
jgi:hypothetical protein